MEYADGGGDVSDAQGVTYEAGWLPSRTRPAQRSVKRGGRREPSMTGRRRGRRAVPHPPEFFDADDRLPGRLGDAASLSPGRDDRVGGLPELRGEPTDLLQAAAGLPSSGHRRAHSGRAGTQRVLKASVEVVEFVRRARAEDASVSGGDLVRQVEQRFRDQLNRLPSNACRHPKLAGDRGRRRVREDVWRGHEQLRAIVLAGAPPEGDNTRRLARFGVNRCDRREGPRGSGVSHQARCSGRCHRPAARPGTGRLLRPGTGLVGGHATGQCKTRR